MNKIERFIGEHSFLNNFHHSSISIGGKFYPTVEHAYQAHKTLVQSEHDVIRQAASPMEAKKLGRSVILRPDWESCRIDLMKMFIRKKFENPLLRELLKGTGDVILIHDNRFNDRFWGVCRGVGENWLGRILEEVRSEVFHEDSEFADFHVDTL